MKHDRFLSDFKSKLKESTSQVPEPNKCNRLSVKPWRTCTNECATAAETAFKTELESTAYFLRVLAGTTIGSRGIVVIYSNPSAIPLTGKWASDMNLFKIKPFNKKGRLIMGFGPSASGKTFWAKNLIDIMRISDTKFPDTFISIDGGLYRELSTVYQTIVEHAKQTNIGGFTNLVLAGISITQSSLFSSSKLKKNMIVYLTAQPVNTNISLYVPETLGDCGKYRTYSCRSKIQPYVNITGDDKWIGSMIYQHKTGNECTYDFPYKCTGSTESGQLREMGEGKQYSSAAFEHSYAQGIIEMNKAPGARFIIHNSGGRKHNSVVNRSIITDNSTSQMFTIGQQKKIEDTYHCMYLIGSQCNI
jgi:hypothetical protein